MKVLTVREIWSITGGESFVIFDKVNEKIKEFENRGYVVDVDMKMSATDDGRTVVSYLVKGSVLKEINNTHETNTIKQGE